MRSFFASTLVVRFLAFLSILLQNVLAHDTTIHITYTITVTVTSTIAAVTSTDIATVTEDVVQSVTIPYVQSVTTSIANSVDSPTVQKATNPAGTLGPLQTGAAAYSGPGFKIDVLDTSNHYRAEHQANTLVWNDTLAEYAQKYVERCVFEHSGGPYGENLALRYSDPVAAVDAWASEEILYDYERAVYSDASGHYTQLVWKDSTSVGCGAFNCSNPDGAIGWMMVCEYSPRGNVIGWLRQNVGKPGIGADGRLGFASNATHSTAAAGNLDFTSRGYRRTGGMNLAGMLVTAYAVLAILA